MAGFVKLTLVLTLVLTLIMLALPIALDESNASPAAEHSAVESLRGGHLLPADQGVPVEDSLPASLPYLQPGCPHVHSEVGSESAESSQ